MSGGRRFTRAGTRNDNARYGTRRRGSRRVLCCRAAEAARNISAASFHKGRGLCCAAASTSLLFAHRRAEPIPAPLWRANRGASSPRSSLYPPPAALRARPPFVRGTDCAAWCGFRAPAFFAQASQRRGTQNAGFPLCHAGFRVLQVRDNRHAKGFTLDTEQRRIPRRGVRRLRRKEGRRGGTMEPPETRDGRRACHAREAKPNLTRRRRER